MIKKEFYKGVILAIDTASRKTGYAVYSGGKVVDSGTWKTKPDTYHRQLYSRIMASARQWGVTQIVAEDIFKSTDQQKTNAYPVLCECKGVAQLCAQLLGVSVAFIQSIAVKQYMYHYNIKMNYSRSQHKSAMINAVKRLGYTLENDTADDEADAIGLLLAYLGERYKITHPVEQVGQ